MRSDSHLQPSLPCRGGVRPWRDVTHRLPLRTGFSNLCKIDPSSGAVTRLTRDGRPGGPLYAVPSYSRDGRKMTFTFGNDLYVARGDATDRKLLERRVGTDYISPDGKQVALVKILPEPIGIFCPGYICIGGAMPYLFIRPAGNGKLETVARAVATAGWWRGRILIGDRKSAEEGQSICLLRTNTGHHCERDVAVDPIRNLWGPAGSPNGRYIAATAAPRPPANETTKRIDGSIATLLVRDGRARPQPHPWTARLESDVVAGRLAHRLQPGQQHLRRPRRRQRRWTSAVARALRHPAELGKVTCGARPR